MKNVYEKKGTLNALPLMTALFLSLFVLVIVVMLTGSIGGTMYANLQPTLSGINNSNVSTPINKAITDSFGAVSLASGNISIIVLAIIAAVVLTLVFSFGGFAGGNNEGGNYQL